MATALDDLLEAFPNGWTPADSTKQSGPSLFDTHLDNGPLTSNDHSQAKMDALPVANGKHIKTPLNDINLFDEPISELGDHEPLVTAKQSRSAIVLPARTETAMIERVIQGEHNPAEDILTSLLYPETANGSAGRTETSTPARKPASKASPQGPKKQSMDSSKSRISPPRTSRSPIINGRPSAWAGSNPAAITHAKPSKSPPSGYGYTPPTAVSPKGTIRISGIAKAVEAQRQEDKLRRKEEKRRCQEKEIETPSSTATSSAPQTPLDDFLTREPSESSDEGWIDAATYNARKGWRRPNVPHSVQADDEDDHSDTYVPEKKKPDMWSQEDVEVEKMEQARIVTERTQKMQLLDFEVAPEPENIVPAWQPTGAKSSNKYPAPQVVREARPPNTFKTVPRHRDPDTISHKSAHWADEDDRGAGRGRGRGRGDSSSYRDGRGRSSRGPLSSPEHSLSGSNANPVSRDPEARLRAASDWIQPRIEVAGPFQDQYRSAWEAQRKGITNPRSGRGRGVARY